MSCWACLSHGPGGSRPAGCYVTLGLKRQLTIACRKLRSVFVSGVFVQVEKSHRWVLLPRIPWLLAAPSNVLSAKCPIRRVCHRRSV